MISYHIYCKKGMTIPQVGKNSTSGQWMQIEMLRREEKRLLLLMHFEELTCMNDWVHIDKNKSQMAREKQKARVLRKSNWWQALIAKGVCHYCGGRFAPGNLTMDHIVPLSRGGKSSRSNIVACCKECNNEKKYYTPAEIVLSELEQEALDPDDGSVSRRNENDDKA